MTMKSFCDNRGSIFNIITLGKKLINLFIQDIFYYIVQIICTWLYKSDFIMAIIAQVSDVAHRLLVIPPIEWNLEYYVKPTINILSDKCKNCSLPILIVGNNLNYNVKKIDFKRISILHFFNFLFFFRCYFIDHPYRRCCRNIIGAFHKDLNTVFENSTFESNGDIRWQKRIANKYKDIAMFSLPESPLSIDVKEMRPLSNNRTELIAPNTSRAAIMIIKNPICWDKGTYRCRIVYFSEASKKKSDQRFCCRI